MQICPECQTEQPATAPFCTNCGYRIGRAETLREGMGAISDAMLAEYLQNGGQRPSKSDRSGERRVSKSDRSGERSGSEIEKPTRDSSLRDTMEESAEAVTIALPVADLKSAMASQMATDSDGPRTIVEGLKVISPANYDSGPAKSKVDASSERRAAADFAKTVPEREAVVDSRVESTKFTTSERAHFGMLSGLWIGGTLLGLLLVFFVVDQRASARSMGVLSAEVKASVEAASHRIHIPEGPFRSGLNEETRSYILQSCRRFYDDPDEQCEQDKLLPGEFPERTVELDSFHIDSKEVTNAHYETCVKSGACTAIQYRECGVWTPQGLQISLRVPKTMQVPEVAASCVTRAEAATFCTFVGGYLPSHNQWEKAARGEDGGLFPWGDSWASDLANWGEMDIFRTSAVGKLDGFEWVAPPGHYPAGKSPYGVLDMAGNVSEWVQSDDPLVGYARGGSWISNPFELRATGRLRIRASDRRTDVGFRCAY